MRVRLMVRLVNTLHSELSYGVAKTQLGESWDLSIIVQRVLICPVRLKRLAQHWASPQLWSALGSVGLSGFEILAHNVWYLNQ